MISDKGGTWHSYDRGAGSGGHGGETVKVLEGNILKSKLTGTIFEVKKIKDRSVVLESKEGADQEWTDMGNLPLFFEESENQSSL
jgi:hypothetical protein